MSELPVRKPWSEEETKLLINAWEDIASITVISVLLNRSSSSVQTQASRINLPRRGEQLKRHRRRWLRSEERQLDSSLSKNTDFTGRIDIYAVAEDLNRSVDAIAAKIEGNFSSETEMFSKLIIPEGIKRKFNKSLKSDPQEEEITYKMPGEISDTRYVERMRKCLTCAQPFWSEGAHNRICDKCKKAHDSDDLGAE